MSDIAAWMLFENCSGLSRPNSRGTEGSPLEERGFEPPVPPKGEPSGLSD
jgi:hypothetical protein